MFFFFFFVLFLTGSLTGFLVGGSMGILGGGYGAFAGGMRGRELMRAGKKRKLKLFFFSKKNSSFKTIFNIYYEFTFIAGKASVQGGAMFALILGIGSALRGCLK